MLLDIGAVLGGIGLAVVGFLVVILVCVGILRLLAAILPSYEDHLTPAAGDVTDESTTEGEEIAAASAPGDGEQPAD